jgi:predicted amidohydrolase
MRSPLKIAAAQPACVTNHVHANALEHADLIRSAEARVVVFPELSLTGYDVDVRALSTDDEALRPVADACAETGTVALVGAPVEGEAGEMHIAMLRVSGTGIDVVYRKSYLGGDEPSRFTGGNGAVAIDVDGWRIGLGICKDTGVEQHIADIAALDVDAYIAGLLHRRDQLDIQEKRAVRIAQACEAYVAFASFAGPTGGGYDQTAGVSSIWAPNGKLLARAGSEPGGIAVTVLPL